ncbi:hypothetical protein GCM10027051_23550 [Niabella terrae]
MPIFFQQDINQQTRLGIWQITEPESFFIPNVPLHREVSHPHKRLQHLAGRFLLKYLFPDFPSQLIRIADTRKPYLPDADYQFSISHCGQWAAAIVSRHQRVGIDIEIPVEKIVGIRQKFVSKEEMTHLDPKTVEEYTQIWSAKEAVFKWYGAGQVDFRRHIQLRSRDQQRGLFHCLFTKNDNQLEIPIRQFPGLCLSSVCTEN